jgi:hypothetical protein
VAVVRLASLALLAATGMCSNPPPSPPVTPVGAAAIWSELVEAGCAKPDDAGPAGVAKELEAGKDTGGIGCLAAGGSVTSCGVPCRQDAGKP